MSIITKLKFKLQKSSISKWWYLLAVLVFFVIQGLWIFYGVFYIETEPVGRLDGLAELIILELLLAWAFSLVFCGIYLWKWYPCKHISLKALFPPYFIIPKAVLSAFFVFILYYFAKYSLLLFRQEGLDWWQYLVTWLIMWTLLMEAYLYLNGLSALMLNKPKGFSWINHVGVLVLFFVILPMASTTVMLVVWSKFF